MPSIYQLKSRFQGILKPLVQFLYDRGVTANQVTVFALFLSFAEGLAIAIDYNARWPFLLLPILLFVRMALNAIDGMLARNFNMQSKLGAILNELGDVFSDAFLYLPFALIPHVSGALVAGVVILAVISEMTGVVAVQIGASRRYDGPMGKSDRAFLFGAIGLLMGLGVSVNIWLNIVLGITLILLGLTVINRAKQALKETLHART